MTCTHDNLVLDKACCSGEEALWCACGGMDAVYCPDCDITDEEANRVLGVYV